MVFVTSDLNLQLIPKALQHCWTSFIFSFRGLKGKKIKLKLKGTI
jgi:hypothetical protein